MRGAFEDTKRPVLRTRREHATRDARDATCDARDAATYTDHTAPEKAKCCSGREYSRTLWFTLLYYITLESVTIREGFQHSECYSPTGVLATAVLSDGRKGPTEDAGVERPRLRHGGPLAGSTRQRLHSDHRREGR